MKTFRQHMAEKCINEAIVRKGAVAAYGLQGKTHGDEALRHYREAKRLLAFNIQNRSADQKIDLIMSAVAQMADGLISQRQQVGSVSAQITSLSLI
jgi:hypothetical protein